MSNGGGATYDATFNKGGGNYTATPDTDVTIEDLLLNSGNAPLSPRRAPSTPPAEFSWWRGPTN